MKRFLIPIILLVSTLISAQGKIYSAEQLEKEYGKVKYEVSITSDELLRILDKTDNKLLFKVFPNRTLSLMKDSRVAVDGFNRVPDPEEIMYAFSKEIVFQVIKQGDGIIRFQVRDNGVQTIQSNDVGAEKSEPCPPFCIKLLYNQLTEWKV